MKRFNVMQHKELAQMSLGRVQLDASRHALDKALERGLRIPSILDIAVGTIVEIEVEGRVLVKAVVRVPGNNRDEVYVLRPINGMYKVITCYFNDTNDNHATLNLARVN